MIKTASVSSNSVWINCHSNYSNAIHFSVPECTYLGAVLNMYVGVSMSMRVCIELSVYLCDGKLNCMIVCEHW